MPRRVLTGAVAWLAGAALPEAAGPGEEDAAGVPLLWLFSAAEMAMSTRTNVAALARKIFSPARFFFGGGPCGGINGGPPGGAAPPSAANPPPGGGPGGPWGGGP